MTKTSQFLFLLSLICSCKIADAQSSLGMAMHADKHFNNATLRSAGLDVFWESNKEGAFGTRFRAGYSKGRAEKLYAYSPYNTIDSTLGIGAVNIINLGMDIKVSLGNIGSVPEGTYIVASVMYYHSTTTYTFPDLDPSLVSSVDMSSETLYPRTGFSVHAALGYEYSVGESNGIFCELRAGAPTSIVEDYNSVDPRGHGIQVGLTLGYRLTVFEQAGSVLQ